MTRPTYHQSELSDFEFCSWAYCLEHQQGNRGSNNVFNARGNGTHKAREVNLRQKVTTGEDLPLEEMMDAARDCINAESEWLDLNSDPIIGLGRRRAVGYIIDTTLPLVKVDLANNQSRMQPLEVEVKIAVRLPDYPFDLAMKLDSIDRVGHGNGVIITDLKTTKKQWAQKDADNSYQPKVYKLGVRVHLPSNRSAGFRFHIVSCTPKQRRTRAYELIVDPAEQAIVAVLERFRAMHHSIEAGMFGPCHQTHWKCSPQWCDYYRQCKYVGNV